jgi:sodium-dependent phosphate cotransporter
MKFADPLKAITKPIVSWLIELFGSNPVICLIFALIIMYAALKFLVDLARGVVIKRAERYLHRYLFGAAPVAMLFGIIMTIMVQSSSITTSMIVPLIGAGQYRHHRHRHARCAGHRQYRRRHRRLRPLLF